jgi:hypothetical protein
MTEPVRIPADVDRPDRILANLTARQVAILAVAGLLLYAVWSATRTVVPAVVFGLLSAPVAAAVAALALGSRDGMPLDLLLIAAVRQRLAPRRQVAAPEGIHPAPAWLTARTTHRTDTTSTAAGRLRLPAEGVTAARAGGGADVGVVDLGGDGLAIIVAASTVNFALRTPTEQEALVAVFARYLHSLTAPVQILIRAERLDLTGQIDDLRARAPGLPHPALEAAAVEHADYLTQLAAETDLLRRQALLILREPLHQHIPPRPTRTWGGRRGREQTRAQAAAVRAAQTRLARRLAEAADLLAPAGITVTGLDPAQATAVLAAACNPDTLVRPGSGLAAADEVITTAPTSHDDQSTSTHASAPAGTAARGHDEDDDYQDDWDDEGWDDAEDEEDGDHDGDGWNRGRGWAA